MTPRKIIRQNIILVCIAMLSLIGFEVHQLIKEYSTTNKSVQLRMDELLTLTAKMYGQQIFISEMSNPQRPSFTLKPIDEIVSDSIPINFTKATINSNLSEGLELLMITSAIKRIQIFLTHLQIRC